MDSRLLFVFVPLCLLIVCLLFDLIVAWVVDNWFFVVFSGLYAWFWYCAAQPPYPGYDPYQEPWDETDQWYNEC